jgi:hypothetical protein
VNGGQGRASANKAGNAAKISAKCRGCDDENGFDREDVLWRAQRRWRQPDYFAKIKLAEIKSGAYSALTFFRLRVERIPFGRLLRS